MKLCNAVNSRDRVTHSRVRLTRTDTLDQTVVCSRHQSVTKSNAEIKLIEYEIDWIENVLNVARCISASRV